MRIYLPSTLPALAALLTEGEAGHAPFTGYAVTPALREQHGDGDGEESEYIALLQAADASLWRLAADPAAPRRRVVIAAEIPESMVHVPGRNGDPPDDPGAVLVLEAVPLTKVVSAHVDDEGAAADISAAAADPEAGHEEAHELMWYATQEFKYLLD